MKAVEYSEENTDRSSSLTSNVVRNLNVSTGDVQDVQDSKLVDYCLLSFNLSNTTEQAILLNLVDSTPLKLASHSTRRLVVPIPQLALSLTQIDSLCQFNDPQISTFLQLRKYGELNFPSRLLYALTKSLVDSLKFSWSSGTRGGELCLHHIQLDPDSITHLLKPETFLSHSVKRTSATITAALEIKVNGTWTLELQPILEMEDGYSEDIHDFLESSSKPMVVGSTPSTVEYTVQVLKPCKVQLLYILTMGDIDLVLSDSIRLC